MEADVCVVNGATYVREGSDFGESGSGFLETAAAGGDFDEFRVEFGGQEAGYHVCDFGNEVGFEGVTFRDGFSGKAEGETGEDHGDGVVGGEGEV